MRAPRRAGAPTTARAPPGRRASDREAAHGLGEREPQATGHGLAHAREPAQRRPHEQLEAGQHRERVAGQRHHDAAVAFAGPGGLAGLQRDPPEELAHAQLAQRGLDVVVRADRDAARGEHEIGRLERARERRTRRPRVVGDSLDADDFGPELAAAGREEAAVRLVDLSALQGLGWCARSSPVTTMATRGRRCTAISEIPAALSAARASGTTATPPAAPRFPGEVAADLAHVVAERDRPLEADAPILRGRARPARPHRRPPARRRPW